MVEGPEASICAPCVSRAGQIIRERQPHPATPGVFPTGDPLEILLAHDIWATVQLLQACMDLTPEQFQQSFEIGPGSLHNTTTHIIGTMRRWTDMLAGREFRPRLESDSATRTPEQLLELLESAGAELIAIARAHPEDEIVSAVRGGRTWAFPRGGVITHVATHGMHHRAQCLNMLRRLGVDPLPQSSVFEWMLMVEKA